VPVPGLYGANAASIGPVQARYWQLMACLQGHCFSVKCLPGSFLRVLTADYSLLNYIVETTGLSEGRLKFKAHCKQLPNCLPSTHVMCQQRASTGPMLAASAQCWHITTCLQGYCYLLQPYKLNTYSVHNNT